MRSSSRFTFTLSLMLLLAVTVSGCGGSSASSGSSGTGSTTTHCGFFKKAKIGLHIGVAYFAFHHWLYKPWRAGEFRKGAPKRKRRIVKAIIATLVGVHEAKVAVRQLQACGAGKRVAGLVSAAESKLTGMRSSTTDTTPDSQLNSQLQGLSSSFSQIRSAGTS
jgi:hypothetical protein